ncbi:MAG: hypothetical protein LBH00_11005, partial [Planctomycetaceae bacterium]|nr:hypothetical protein [Planctomycetaceae bacterium]
HEFGHQIQYAIGQSLKEWYNKNAKGNPFKMATFAGRIKYKETMRRLPVSLPEDVDQKMYAAKRTTSGSTELMSSFFEFLFEDAAALLTNHSDFCKLVLKALEDKK